jgi:Mrp family chromosome partitioning ATPase/uncharacterized protein involved in exopolysaccharide biosynthesis
VKEDGITYQLVTETGYDEPSGSPLRLARRVLRGRYRLVILLAVLLAALGGVAGYIAAPPVYESTGLVRIEGALPAILYPTQESQVPPMFDAYVASQVTHLQSRQVLDAAVSMPRMMDAGWPAGAKGIAELQEALTVRRQRGEQVISVSVRQRDPHRAQSAVNAVLAAFSESYTDPGGLPLATKEQALVQREGDLEQAIQGLRGKMLEASDQYGLEAIERMHAGKVDELIEIDEKLAEIRLARAGTQTAEHPDGLEPTFGDRRLDAEPKLSALEEEELALLAEITSSRYAPDHPVISRLIRRLEAVRIQIELRDRALGGRASASADTASASPPGHLDRLEEEYEASRDRIRADVARLGQQRIVVAGLSEQVAQIKQRLATTRARLDELRFEADHYDLDRISITNGELPVAPASNRRQGLATAGTLFGAACGAAIVFLIGLCDRRVRYVDELESMGFTAPIVTLLPDLDAGDTTSEHRAAGNVRQLRHLLELRGVDPDQRVHAVTSCGRGDGKTSLSLALGASFAAAGRRTLLIDADFEGFGLSRRLGLGNLAGLTEALGPDPHGDLVRETGESNLWAMPIGSGRGTDPETISRPAINRLLGDLRPRFDAIIVDSGPITTGIAAGLVASVSDGAVVVIGRSQKTELVRSSISRLRQVGAECVAVVFNKAAESDFKRRRAGGGGPEGVGPMAPTAPSAGDEDLGPLARVTGATPTTHPASGYTRKWAA